MTPVQQYEAKRKALERGLKRQGFNPEFVREILAGTRPGNIDDVLRCLEDWEKEDTDATEP